MILDGDTTGLAVAEALRPDPEEAAMRRMLIRRAADTYVLGSLDKIGTAAPYRVADASEVAGIITDAPSYHTTIQQLRQQGVNIIPAT